jgi:hypothetical protein
LRLFPGFFEAFIGCAKALVGLDSLPHKAWRLFGLVGRRPAGLEIETRPGLKLVAIRRERHDSETALYLTMTTTSPTKDPKGASAQRLYQRRRRKGESQRTSSFPSIRPTGQLTVRSAGAAQSQRPWSRESLSRSSVPHAGHGPRTRSLCCHAPGRCARRRHTRPTAAARHRTPRNRPT